MYVLKYFKPLIGKLIVKMHTFQLIFSRVTLVTGYFCKYYFAKEQSLLSGTIQFPLLPMWAAGDIRNDI